MGFQLNTTNCSSTADPASPRQLSPVEVPKDEIILPADCGVRTRDVQRDIGIQLGVKGVVAAAAAAARRRGIHL